MRGSAELGQQTNELEREIPRDTLQQRVPVGPHSKGQHDSENGKGLHTGHFQQRALALFMYLGEGSLNVCRVVSSPYIYFLDST